MKNKYLTRFLCMTIASGMMLSGTAAVYAAEDEAAYTSDGSGFEFSDSSDFDSEPSEPTPAPEEPTPEPVDPTPVDPTPSEPTPAPEEPTPTPDNPTPTPDNPTPTPDNPTPTPDNPTPTPDNPTPTPDNPTPTPTPASQITAAAQAVIDRISELDAQGITLEKKAMVQSIRTAYNALSKTEQEQVSNYNMLVQAEAKITQLEKQQNNNNNNSNNSFTDNTTPTAQTGTPVYYASNIHAGKDFYLDSLKNNYHLTFSDDFASVMSAIEKEYKEKNKIADATDINGSKTTTSADSLLVRNWQDILAVYIYQQSKDGKTEYTLDASCKDDLAKIFAEMNPIVRDKQNITHVTLSLIHI